MSYREYECPHCRSIHTSLQHETAPGEIEPSEGFAGYQLCWRCVVPPHKYTPLEFGQPDMNEYVDQQFEHWMDEKLHKLRRRGEE